MSNLLDKIKELKTIQEQSKKLDIKINEINENNKQHPDTKNVDTCKDIYTQNIENTIKKRKDICDKNTSTPLNKNLSELEVHNDKKAQPTLLYNNEVKALINDILLEESKNSNININYDEIEVDDTCILSILQSNNFQNLNNNLKDLNKFNK